MPDPKSEETGMALVASILSGIQASQLATERRMGAMEGKLGEIHEEVKRTNGRVTEIETWRDGWQDESDQAEAYAAGRKSIRDGDRALAKRILGWLGSKWPVAIIALLAGAGARMAAWFIGVPW